MVALRSAATILKSLDRLDSPDSANGGQSQSSLPQHKIEVAIADRVGSQRLSIIPFALELLSLGVMLLLQENGHNDRKLVQNPQRSRQGQLRYRLWWS